MWTAYGHCPTHKAQGFSRNSDNQNTSQGRTGGRLPTMTHTSASGRWPGTGTGRPGLPGPRCRHSPRGGPPPSSASPVALGWVLGHHLALSHGQTNRRVRASGAFINHRAHWGQHGDAQGTRPGQAYRCASGLRGGQPWAWVLTVKIKTGHWGLRTAPDLEQVLN